MQKGLSPYDIKQLSLFEPSRKMENNQSYFHRLQDILSGDLNFHRQKSNYASHNFHSFPAKFPPQLPAKFISNLTAPGEVVLDPMMGSGTTVLEAYLAGRKAIGFDIDPLALKISKVKTTPLKKNEIKKVGRTIIETSRQLLRQNQLSLDDYFRKNFDAKTREFIEYWFSPIARIELLALSTAIKKLSDAETRTFFELIFSSIIITKSGGVSLALDLAHTRPHKARAAYGPNGQLLYGDDFLRENRRRSQYLIKKYRSPLEEFEKKFDQNFSGLLDFNSSRIQPNIQYGNAENLPLDNDSVDLIVTSPPYASNAIDYMRAHKFSLVWFNNSIEDLSEKRKKYIGGEGILNLATENLPDYTLQIVELITKIDSKKGRVLLRYYSEMKRVLREMFRVLKPGKAAILVVGNSILRGRSSQTHHCLADIGKDIGFEVPPIGVRLLDRNRRMMPAGLEVDKNSQI